MIEPSQVVFIDGGTTALQLARHLPQGIEVTIITHRPNVAMELINHENIQIEIVGGSLFRHSIVTCGAATISWINRYRPDLCFIGATSLHPEEEFTTGNSEEAEVNRAIISESGSALILASSEKLEAVSSFEVANWPTIDGIVISQSAQDKAQDMFAHFGCAS